MFLRTGDRLVLRFNPGQFSFRNYAAQASNEAVFSLAQELNRFQDDPATEIQRVQEFELAD